MKKDYGLLIDSCSLHSTSPIGRGETSSSYSSEDESGNQKNDIETLTFSNLRGCCLKKAFTLIEIMVGMLIISSVLVIGFDAYSKVGIGKINLIEQTNLQKDSFYFSERLFQLIKEGGSIDYEEYFNRKVIGTDIANGNGHYEKPSGFGNFGKTGIVGTSTFGEKFYYCRSGNGENSKMTDNGCYNNDLNTEGSIFKGEQQRYGEYSFQFIDYNSNYNNDNGDENGDGEIIGDDDDEFLGVGPIVFEAGTDVKELYLLSGDKKRRTYIRWNILEDTEIPNDGSVGCNPNSLSEDDKKGCRGKIEFLKLEGFDWGMDHIKGDFDQDGTENDGVIDTWLIDKQFASVNSDNVTGLEVKDIIAGSEDMEDYWQPLFPTSVNVTDFKVFVYPNIDYNNAWKDSSESTNISPYVILKYKIKPSWEMRKKIKSGEKEVNISSTINLTDIFSK